MDISILLALQEFRNGFLKVTACAYRTWIRDAAIIPHGNAMKEATGYDYISFFK